VLGAEKVLVVTDQEEKPPDLRVSIGTNRLLRVGGEF
jgi:hypothetical protein